MILYGYNMLIIITILLIILKQVKNNSSLKPY